MSSEQSLLVQASACTFFLEADASNSEADASRWLPQADACGSENLNYMQKRFSTFLFGNFWIAIIAIMMCYFTEKALGIILPDAFLPFVGFATLTSYSFHAYLSSFYISAQKGFRLPWIQKNKAFLLGQSLCSALVSSYFFLALASFSLYILPIILATFLYSAPQIPVQPFISLRKIAIAKTLYLSLSWAYITIALPILVGGIPFFEAKNVYFLLNRFLLIYVIAILFDQKDKEADQLLAVKNAITYLKPTQIKGLISLCCALFFISSFLFFQVKNNASLTFALLLPMFFFLLSFFFVEKTENDYVYYGYLDGLLAVSGIEWLTF